MVLEREVYSGQYVGDGDRLLTIADASVLWFRFDVYERQLAWLEPGQTIEVTVPAVPGKVFSAVISFIEPTVNNATRTVRVRADLPNAVVAANGHPRRLLSFGMYAEGRVHTQVPNTLAVPRTAILYPGASTYAYVDKGDGAYERRRVKLGRQGDDLWEVLEGLDEGERVVSCGNVLIDAQAQFNQGSNPEMGEADRMAMAEPQAGEGQTVAHHHSSGRGVRGPRDDRGQYEDEARDARASDGCLSGHYEQAMSGQSPASRKPKRSQRPLRVSARLSTPGWPPPRTSCGGPR